MKQLFIIVTIYLLFATAAHASEQYLCKADRTSGFSFNQMTNEWTSTVFQANSNYVISKRQDDSSAFIVRKIGGVVTAVCEDGFKEGGFLYCEGLGSYFNFNRNNGRYILSYPIGYINVLPELNNITDETSSTPYIEIGKCSPF